nr:hypothetical protein [Tanacetum cinerariifolium]
AISPPRPFKDGWHNSSIVRRLLLVGLKIFLKDVEIKAISCAISLSLRVSSSSLTTSCSNSRGGEGVVISFPLLRVAACDLVVDDEGL